MKKIIKIVLICLEVAVLFVVVGALTTAITKNIYADILIEQFKSKGVLDEKSSSAMVKVYKIPSEEELSCAQNNGVEYYPGNEGDILITLQSELDIPFIHDFVSFFAGGHAGLVLGDYKDELDSVNNMSTVESSGLNEDLNLADSSSKTYWTMYQHPVIGLRVKMTEEERKMVVARGMALIGDPYNYSFLFDVNNKAYCSDLVGKAFSSIGVNLNKDGFTTSVYDLLVSSETYICYYQYTDNAGIKHIYLFDTK